MARSEDSGTVAKCNFRYWGITCDRPAWDDEGLCICHSKKPGKNVQIFQSEVKAMLGRQDYGFTGFLFPGATDFTGVTFDGPPQFESATFSARASFMLATFQAGANFSAATFQGEADFAFATFKGPAQFINAELQGAVDFVRATFQDNADFRGATFQGAARFAESGDKGSFSREAEADFRGAHFLQPERIVFHHVFLGRARFLAADVRRVDLTDVEWARRGGHLAVWDEVAPQAEGERKEHALIGKLYRQLKHNYEEQRDPVTAGDFHFGEMEMRLRSSKRPLFLWLYRLVSGYGENYRRALSCILIVIALFGLLFAYCPESELQPGKGGLWHELARGLLRSVLCFLLRSHRPYRPVHLAGQYLCVFEGVIGAALIALFVLALNRRFKR